MMLVEFFKGLWYLFLRLLLKILNLLGCSFVGEFKGRYLVQPPVIEDPEKFGKASKNPTLLELYVSTDKQWPLSVGKLVNDTFFRTDPPIVFNVCFSCAKPTMLHGGDYSNPESHWWNVFFGFYEIDVPAGKEPDGWERPFGFMSNTPGDLRPNFCELMKIGKADWNYFSNHVYGVPLAHCRKHDDIPKCEDGIPTEGAACSSEIIEDLHGHKYVEGMIDGMEVVSGYASRAGDRLENPYCIISAIWRSVFGRPRPSPSFPKSFEPTTMKMKFLARWVEEYDDDLKCVAYKTFIYGGAINKTWAEERAKDLSPEEQKEDADFLEAFLTEQMNAVIATIGDNDRHFRKMTEKDYRGRSRRHPRWKKKLF